MNAGVHLYLQGVFPVSLQLVLYYKQPGSIPHSSASNDPTTWVVGFFLFIEWINVSSPVK